MRRLCLIVLLVAACGSPTPGSASPGAIDPDDVAAAYLAVASTANDAIEAASPGMSGTPEQIRASCATRVLIERQYVDGLDGIAFPPELFDLVETLKDVEASLIDNVEGCAEAGLAYVQAIASSEVLAQASRAVIEAARELRANLRLPTENSDGSRLFH